MDPQRFNVPVFGPGPTTDPGLDDLYLDDLFGSDLYWNNTMTGGGNNDPLSSSSGGGSPNDDFQTSTLPSTSSSSMNLPINIPHSSSTSSSPYNINNNVSNNSISAQSLPHNRVQKPNESFVTNAAVTSSTTLSSSASSLDNPKTLPSNVNVYPPQTANNGNHPTGSFEMNAWLVPPVPGTHTSSTSIRTRGKGRVNNAGNDNPTANQDPSLTTVTSHSGGGGKTTSPMAVSTGTGRKAGNAKTATTHTVPTDTTSHSRTLSSASFTGKSRSTWEDTMDHDDDEDDSDDDDDDDDDDDSANETSTALTGAGAKRKRSSKDPNDRIARSRERNRIHARKSRMRKKFFMDSLKTNLDNLEEENRRLRALLESETGKTYEEYLQNEKNGVASGKRSHASASNANTTVDDIGNPQRLLAGPGIKPSIILDGYDYALVQALTTGQQNFVVTDPNLHDNPIVFASQGFYNLTGYSPNEVIGRNCRFLQGPATDPDAIRTIRQSISKGLDTAVCLINYKKDGTPFWNQFFIAPLCGTDGRIVNFVGVQCEVKESVARLLLAAQLKALQSSNDTAAASSGSSMVNNSVETSSSSSSKKK